MRAHKINKNSMPKDIGNTNKSIETPRDLKNTNRSTEKQIDL